MFKCQSLGNSFILFDWLNKTEINIDPVYVQYLCKRADVDGMLIVKRNLNNQIDSLIFNADGSNGDKCINGLRCIAYYLVTQKNYPSELEIFMGDRLMECSVTDKIIINVGKANYIGEHTVGATGQSPLHGHIVNVGNPHFVILQKTDLHWLIKNGAAIEQHQDFSDRTNVEFVWPAGKNSYNMLVYERGYGITLACGSGAAAVLQVLYQLRKIHKNEKVLLNMQGGILETYIDSADDIIQQVGKFDHEGKPTTSVCVTH
jgi:diaminopimelate epimerase